MRKARFTEHQIIAVIKSVSLKPPTTTGSPDTAAWKLLILKK